MTCLENIIKLSRTNCNCFPQGSPAVNISDGQTEVYLDELEGLNLSILTGAADCEEGNIWEMMVKARENAIYQFQSDLMSCIEDNYIAKRPNYSGYIGELAHNSSLSITETTAGIVVRFPRIVGGKLKLRKIGLIMNAALAISVSIYNNDLNQTTPIGTYTINSLANAVNFGTLVTPLELPLWSNSVNNLEYYFVYNVSGFQPRNNKTVCVPCSGGVKNVVWANWLTVTGIKGNGTDYASYRNTAEINGLVLDAELTCNGSRVICSDEYPLDFENNGKARQMAYAVRFKAGALLIDDILSSPQINRYTMMDREALYGKRNHYRAKYEEWIKYLCANTPIINNDCWICKPSGLISRGTILS